MGQLDQDRVEDRGGLVPVVTQDERTGEVLMLAYMNAEAEERTRQSGYATYFSRSRQALWPKGETSGNRQRVVRLDADCDGDARLLSVRQEGEGACHTGLSSCFRTGAAVAGTPATGPGPVLLRLERTLDDRLRRRPDGSYTARLAAEGTARVAQKVVEEAGETAIAAAMGDRAAVVREAADLVYHLWLLLRVSGASYAELAEELAAREGPRPT
jgi:phosphoribosyl-ATP pyrophosphohydrolase/phosphoribosyl-AMP cyclohydrolase